MWCVAELDPEYMAKMEDLLATYEKPLDVTQPVVCIDEKPVSLHDDVRPGVRAGVIAKRDNEYKRCGTANVFCAVEPKAGVHFTGPTPNRSAAQFAQVIGNLAAHDPAASTIPLVMDNLNIHCRKSLTDSYGVEGGGALWDRFTLHYTPKHGSWLNQAEIEISLFSRRCLGNRRIPTLKLLKRQAQAWNRRTNRDRVKIHWTFDRKAARKTSGYKYSFKRSKTSYFPSQNRHF
jgi:hypothetical protein